MSSQAIPSDVVRQSSSSKAASVEAPRQWFLLAPIALRLIMGAYLIFIGYTILTNITSTVEVLTKLGIPMASMVVYGVGSIPVLGGLAIVIGFRVKTAAWLVIFSVAAHLIFALGQGGFPLAANGTLPIPGIIDSILILTGMVSLLIGGAGQASLDYLMGRGHAAPKFRQEALAESYRMITGLYLMTVGVPIVLDPTVRAATVATLNAIGIPMAEIVVLGVGLIPMVGGLFMIVGIYPAISSLLQIFSILSHVVFALMKGGFPAPDTVGIGMTYLPIPNMGTSILLLALLVPAVIANAGVYMDAQRHRLNLLNLMSPITKGKEAQVRAVLDEINANLSNNQYIQFHKSELTHFARFIITNHPEGARLGMGTTYNGDLKDYCAELLKVGPGLEALWGNTEGWQGRDKFYEFVKSHSYDSGMVFFGFPGATVKEIRAQIALREKLNELMGKNPAVISNLIDLVDAVKVKSDFSYSFRKVSKKWFNEIVELVRKVAMPPVQEFARFIGSVDIPKNWARMTTNYLGDAERRKKELAHILELEKRENVYAQSTMTVIADIKPGWRVNMIRFLFLIAPPILNFGWATGNFAGVFSLHSFRFAIIDGGKRVWFMSNYNGSAENYFSDFIDKLNWGINAAYTHCTDYPEGGMNQQDAFAYWIRVRQLPALVYYSAYPDQTIHKELSDREISNILGANFDRDDIERLLYLL